MNTLVEQQRALRTAIVSGGDVPGLLAHSAGQAPRIDIYRNAYVARLVAALRDNFGMLPHVMGDEAFDTLARGYVQAHPSQQASIRWFGDGLVAFMEKREDLVPHPALADLARMEWAMRSAFDAADAVAMTAADLASRPPEFWPAMVLRFAPSVQLVEMHWAVEPVWRAMQGFDPASGDEPDLPEPVEQPHVLLVWRPKLENRWRSLEGLDAQLLRSAWQGRDFSALCAEAAGHAGDEDAAPVVVGALQGWLADGLLVGGGSSG